MQRSTQRGLRSTSTDELSGPGARARATTKSTTRTLAALLAFALLLAAPALAQKPGRVLVLGFDGADARTASELMKKGELPNLARLAKEGTFGPLATTTPDESPVSWASLNSGQNPGKTGVPSFIKRELTTYGPMPAAGHVTQEQRAIDEMRAGPVLSFLGGHPPRIVGAACGVGAGLLFLALFVFALRARRKVAVALALVLGCVAAWAGSYASARVPRVIDDIAGNPCEVGGFWEVAAKAGVPCVVLDGAMCWDRPDVENARVLAGLGVPDARGANCDWFVYTTSEDVYQYAPQFKESSTGGRIFRLEERDGKFHSQVYGPRDLAPIGKLLAEKRELQARVDGGQAVDADIDRLEEIASELAAYSPSQYSEEGRRSVELELAPQSSGKVRVRIGAQSQELAAGEWSDWYRVTFELNSLVAVHTVTRVKLVSVVTPTTPLELYVDSLQYDPRKPPFWQPLSQPASFASELAKAIDDDFDTVGWACLTMPFKDSKIDPRTFLEDIEFTHGWRTKLLRAALAKDDWRVLMNVESTTDRVQHMMYRYYDPQHPKYVKEEAEKRLTWFGREITYGDAIPAIYRAMDEMIGEVLDQHVRPGDTLIVCADHGFQSFRRQFQVNNWLVHHGYLALREGITSADGDQLKFVDWSKTKAYSLGLGGIYVNLKGRESTGIVEPADMPALLDEISAKLLATEDELEDKASGTKTKVRAVHEVLRTANEHSGPFVDRGSDLMVGLEAGWRVAWKTTRGGIQLKQDPDRPGEWIAGVTFHDNTSPWSGDHVSVAAPLVSGIFASNRKVVVPEKGVHLLDIAPTVLSLVGVAIPAEYDHAPLKFAD